MVRWLRQQLADDERRALDQLDVAEQMEADRMRDRAPGSVDCIFVMPLGDSEFVARRMLAQVAAMRGLLDEILAYEEKIDSEWGCGHSGEAIAAGDCLDSKPDKIPGLRMLVSVYANYFGFDEEWLQPLPVQPEAPTYMKRR